METDRPGLQATLVAPSARNTVNTHQNERTSKEPPATAVAKPVVPIPTTVEDHVAEEEGGPSIHTYPPLTSKMATYSVRD